jgi:hypothetical protein
LAIWGNVALTAETAEATGGATTAAKAAKATAALSHATAASGTGDTELDSVAARSKHNRPIRNKPSEQLPSQSIEAVLPVLEICCLATQFPLAIC